MDITQKQKQLQEYKASLVGKTLDELRAIEQEIIKEADALDEKIKVTTFKLSKKNYKEAAEAIRYLLNKQSVQWQYALTYVAMFDFWDPEKQPKEVAYAMLDSTLRTLGQLQFTGYNEWCAVIAINKYFETIQEDYVNVTESVYDVASKHNIVMEAMKLNEPIQAVQE